MFGNDAKREQKTREILEKYGLQGLSNPKDQQAIYNLAYEMTGTNLMSLGLLLQGNTVDSAKISAQKAIMEQNFIIIRQLDRIAKALENK